LISNPFASPISWTSVYISNLNANTSLDDAIYVYNPDAGSSDRFTAFVGGIPDDPINGITDEIPMGQGFYVQAVVPTYNLTIDETDKIASNAPLLKSTNVIGSVIRLKLTDSGNKDSYTAIRFHANATTAYDKGLDAHKLYASPGSAASNKRTSIATRSGNLDYAINSLPFAVMDDAVVPVLVRARTTGQYTITGSDLQNLPNSCVILRDKLTGTEHNLKNSPYICTLSDTATTARFELKVCADITLSVDETKGGIGSQNNILIGQDANGAVVKFNFDKATKSTISVTNILGQKIVDSKIVTIDKEVVYLNIPEKNQLLFITVTTEDNKVTKKIIR